MRYLIYHEDSNSLFEVFNVEARDQALNTGCHDVSNESFYEEQYRRLNLIHQMN